MNNYAVASIENTSTSVSSCSAYQISNFACIYNQLSGVVFVALPIFTAILGLMAVLQLINADKVLREIFKHMAASVIVNPSGLITSSCSTFPG